MRLRSCCHIATFASQPSIFDLSANLVSLQIHLKPKKATVMTEKMNLGRLCEYLVKVIIEAKSGWDVTNINDKRRNHPRTDLLVRNRETGEKYEISVKAKQGVT